MVACIHQFGCGEFEALLPAFDQVWQAYQREEERKRGKAYGGRVAGSKSAAETERDKLVYVKVYPLQEVQGRF